MPDHGRASILLPAGARGAAFMIFDNFHVIERYNTADAYVIGVGHLSDRIAGAGPLQAGWPRDDRTLRFVEKQELQETPDAGRVRHRGSRWQDRPEHHRRDPGVPEDPRPDTRRLRELRRAPAAPLTPHVIRMEFLSTDSM